MIFGIGAGIDNIYIYILWSTADNINKIRIKTRRRSINYKNDCGLMEEFEDQ